jgi:acetyltransferase-like isoleucine patch superfamily enzyme
VTARRPLPPTTPPYTRDALARAIAAYGWEIGAESYGVPEIRYLGEPARLVIGKYCSIALGVMITLGGEHRTDWVKTYPFSHVDKWPEAHGVEGHPGTKGDVVIGHDVWLAERCMILSGVTIGTGSVVGAGAVVSRDVEPYQIVAGNPARPIRKRFSDDVIARLLAAAWWDWEETRLRTAMSLLLSRNIEEFLRLA